MQFLHGKGILHNDIHYKNIVIQPFTNQPKIIDFGKATLISNPVLLKKMLSADQKMQYQKFHKHIAYELWNVMYSKQCPATDAYSVGYLFSVIGYEKRMSLLTDISKEMLKKDPENRMTLAEASMLLIKL
jgi:serine/threonine protein kinase